MDHATRQISLVLFLLVCCSSAQAQEGGRHEVLRTADGIPLHITYYPFVESKDNPGATAANAPVVVFLHGEKENRLLWDKSSAPRDQDPFPLLLQKRGYAAITVDLRKHGESVLEGKEEPLLPNDFTAMVGGDLAAVKEFLFTEHQNKKLNMEKLGIVAVGMSVPVAAAFTEYEWKLAPYDDAPLAVERTPRGQEIKALVFISPDSASGRVKANTAMNYLRSPAFKIALQVIVGKDDNVDKRQAESIYQIFASVNKEGDRVELVKPDAKDRGLALMRIPVVYVSVLKFLDVHLKALEIPWQDRRSRRDR